jgi:ABC-type uncharacterized transport system substrate-binding protein
MRLMTRKPHLWTIALAVGLLLITGRALAIVMPQDLQIAARALGFLAKPPSGEVRVAVVYSSDSPQSVQEATHLMEMLGTGLTVGSITLKPTLIPVDALPRVRVGLIFLSPGVGSKGSLVATAARSAQVPCVTTDLTQVRSGNCAIGIRSEPQIEILVNRAAAAASGTTFSTIFRVMITEL